MSLHCYIYKSPLRKETYLYLLKRGDFSVLPDDLLKLFGLPEFSFDFELTKKKKLFQEDSVTVMDNLTRQGYHLQMGQKDIQAILASIQGT